MADGSTEVAAHRGLAERKVTLAPWRSLRGDWARIVHPALHEVLGLHAATSLARDALHLANARSDSR